MANVLRGQIYVTKFDKKIRDEKGKVTSVQNGFRPALIIQNDTGNANSTTTIVAPLTSNLDKPALPTHVLAKTDCGLKENSLILLEQVQTIDQYRLRDLIGTLDEEKMKEVDKALSVSVGLAK